MANKREAGALAAGAATSMPGGCLKRNGPPEGFKDLLACAAAFFKEFKITYRITDGTLIGAWRPGGKFIPWDDDIDVTIDTSNDKNVFDYSMVEKFNNWTSYPKESRCGNVAKMIKVEAKWCTEKNICNLRLLHKTLKHCNYDEPQWLDMDNEANIRADEPPWSSRKKITRDHIYPLKACTLEGISTWCPKETDKYLELYYGSNWKTPTYKEYKNGEWVPDQKVMDQNKKAEQDASDYWNGGGGGGQSGPTGEVSAAAKAAGVTGQAPGCGKDVDCKGSRVCVNFQCADDSNAKKSKQGRQGRRGNGNK
eukprot:g4272.t1